VEVITDLTKRVRAMGPMREFIDWMRRSTGRHNLTKRNSRLLSQPLM